MVCSFVSTSVTHAAMTTQTLQLTWVYCDYQNKFAAIEQPWILYIEIPYQSLTLVLFSEITQVIMEIFKIGF